MVGELLGGPAVNDLIGPWSVLGAAMLGAVGWFSLWRRQRSWAVLLGSWLAATILGIFLFQMRRATFNPFYVAVAAPAWWVLFIAGVIVVGRRATVGNSWGSVFATLFVLAVVGLNALALARYWGDAYEHGRSQGYRQFAQHLEANRQDGDVILTNSPDPALNYYLRNISVPFELQPERQAASDAQIEQELRSLADTYRRLWFVPARQPRWDPENVILRWLDYHLLLEQRRTFAAVTLEGYRPLHSVDELLLPRDNVVNEQLRLEGAYLTADGLPVAMESKPLAIAAGAQLNLSLLWQAEEEIASSYTVFVHVLDAAGQLIAQHDGVPVHGTRPTDTWSVGERILDEHAMRILQEAEGVEGRLVVGLYDPETGERQPFESGAELITLAELQIDSNARSSPVGSL